MRALLTAGLLLLASASAHAGPILPVIDPSQIPRDSSRLGVSCNENFVRETGAGNGYWSGGLNANRVIMNPNPGQSWSGSISLCGYDYSFALTVDFAQGFVQFESTGVNTMPEAQWPLQARSVGGEIRLYYPELTRLPGAEPEAPWPGVRIVWNAFHYPDDIVTTQTFTVNFVPVPEPGTAALVALGLATAGIRSRRSARRPHPKA